jgi:hypothetical protein
MFGQTAGLQHRGPRRPAEAPRGVAIDFDAVRRERKPSPGVDNPLRAPRSETANPLRSGPPLAPDTITEKPLPPVVANIRVVAFDGDGTGDDASPFGGSRDRR